MKVLWGTIYGIFLKFWIWICGGAAALLGFMFSAKIRVYTIAMICLLALLLGAYFYGYTSNHSVQTITHTCEEFRKYLVKGPSADKFLAVLKRHNLCM